MAEHIESIIANCHDLLFHPTPSGINEEEQLLKLSTLDVSWFVTLQICLPILTGLTSTWLYERWKVIKNRGEADAAMREFKAHIAKAESHSSIAPELLRKDVTEILNENGFSTAESPEIADRLIETIQTGLREQLANNSNRE
jgi:hypothetical protein